jgi:hypothetical protein
VVENEVGGSSVGELSTVWGISSFGIDCIYFSVNYPKMSNEKKRQSILLLLLQGVSSRRKLLVHIF